MSVQDNLKEAGSIRGASTPSSLEPSILASPAIPDYRLLRPIGRGAYGEVWLARNLTGSYVALKIVRRGAFDHDRPFEREFEGIKRFEPISRSDPSQLAILHVGRGSELFYYVMELADDAGAASQTAVPGASFPVAERAPVGAVSARIPESWAEQYTPKTLKQLLLDRGELTPAECIEISLALARGLAHLHSHDLVHRDVKPSNVVFVGGLPKLADIGLVTSIEATRSFVGTDGYSPPEGAGTPQADLYSLGKVLYEMSTGFDRKQFPHLPPRFRDSLDRVQLSELNEVVVKACALEVKHRYPSAVAMQADLERLRAGCSVIHVEQQPDDSVQ